MNRHANNLRSFLAMSWLLAMACGLSAQEDFPPPELMGPPPVIEIDEPAEIPLMEESAIWCGAPMDNCGYCAGFGCMQPCGPPWTFYVGSMLMTRDASDRENLLLANPFSPLVRSQSLDFDVEGGVEFSARNDRVGISHTATEIRFTYYGEWNSRMRLFEDDPLIATNPLTAIAGDQDITIDYRSRLLGFEVNALEYACRPVTFLAGFRYLNLDERLSIYLHDPNLPAGPAQNRFVYWDTTNDLFGGQIGANIRVYENGGPLRLHCLMKAGAYLNDAHSHVLLRTNLGTPPNQGSFNNGDAAFVGEVGLNLTYDVNCYAKLRAGYNFLWIDGVALASEQVRDTGSLTAGNSISMTGNSGSILFHGATLGFEFRY